MTPEKAVQYIDGLMVGAQVDSGARYALKALLSDREALRSALVEAMGAVKVFHGAAAWEIYRDHAPEMQRWAALLGGMPEGL